MKDAKGHGSNARGAAHSLGIFQLPTPHQEAMRLFKAWKAMQRHGGGADDVPRTDKAYYLGMATENRGRGLSMFAGSGGN